MREHRKWNRLQSSKGVRGVKNVECQIACTWKCCFILFLVLQKSNKLISYFDTYPQVVACWRYVSDFNPENNDKKTPIAIRLLYVLLLSSLWLWSFVSASDRPWQHETTHTICRHTQTTHTLPEMTCEVDGQNMYILLNEVYYIEIERHSEWRVIIKIVTGVELVQT